MNRQFSDVFMQWARQNSNYWGDYKTVSNYVVANCRMIVTDGYYGEVYAFSSADGCIQ